MIKKKFKNFIHLFTCFFVIVNILDNKGELGLKYISFFILLILLSFTKHKVLKSDYSLFMWLIFFYAYSIVTTILNNGDVFLAFKYNFFFLTIFLCHLLMKNIDKVRMLNFIMNTLFYCSLMIIMGNIFSTIFRVDSIINFVSFFAMNFDDYEGIRQENITHAKIYFHFTLFLPSAFAYFLYENKYLKTILLAIAIILSVSRGAILVSALILIFYIFKFKNLMDFAKRTILIIIIYQILIILISTFIPNIYLHFLELTNNSNYTVTARSSQINLVLSTLFNNISYLLFGMGSGTPIFSLIYNDFIYNIEIAPLEILRKYGIFFFMLLFGFVFKIISQNKKRNLRDAIILTALLLATFTNPILTSPIFILIYFLCIKSNTKLSL